MHNTYIQRLNSLVTPNILTGCVTPALAALSMLCTHSMVINAQHISAACTSDNHNAAHCAPHHANTMQYSEIHFKCYKSIAMQCTAALITYKVGGWS